MKKVIIDTSVWIQNERGGAPELENLLREGRALMHWTVYGELAVGNIKNRTGFLSDLRMLEFCEELSPSAVFEQIEKDSLFGKGFSLVDCILMASAKKQRALIYSFEKRLNTFSG